MQVSDIIDFITTQHITIISDPYDQPDVISGHRPSAALKQIAPVDFAAAYSAANYLQIYESEDYISIDTSTLGIKTQKFLLLAHRAQGDRYSRFYEAAGEFDHLTNITTAFMTWFWFSEHAQDLSNLIKLDYIIEGARRYVGLTRNDVEPYILTLPPPNLRYLKVSHLTA